MFKPGDKVKRVGSDLWDVVYGGVYTVAECVWDELDGGYDLKIVGSSKIYNASAFELVEDTSKHHKHHDLIIQFAKGADIEFFDPAAPVPQWLYTPSPLWHVERMQFRVRDKHREIAKIECEMRKLADRLNQLKEGE